MKPVISPHINPRKKTIEFYIQNNRAHHITLAGSFNHWAHDLLPLKPGKDGIWKIEIPLLPAGKYQYKFYLDDKMWMEDIDNPHREPDGHSGFNSLLVIEK
jgi:1,4-alpha-glucan branching enzyme